MEECRGRGGQKQGELREELTAGHGEKRDGGVSVWTQIQHCCHQCVHCFTRTGCCCTCFTTAPCLLCSFPKQEGGLQPYAGIFFEILMEHL